MMSAKAGMKTFRVRVLAGLFSILFGTPGCLPAQQYVISTFAGGGLAPTPATGTNFTIGSPLDVTTDAAGNVYFASLNCTGRSAAGRICACEPAGGK